MGHCTKLFSNEVSQSCAITTIAVCRVLAQDLGVFSTGLAKLVVFYSSVRQDLIFGTRHAGEIIYYKAAYVIISQTVI